MKTLIALLLLSTTAFADGVSLSNDGFSLNLDIADTGFRVDVTGTRTGNKLALAYKQQVDDVTLAYGVGKATLRVNDCSFTQGCGGGSLSPFFVFVEVEHKGFFINLAVEDRNYTTTYWQEVSENKYVAIAHKQYKDIKAVPTIGYRWSF